MPIFSASQIGSAFAAVIVLTPVSVGSTDQPPPYASATEAYRQGVSAMKCGEIGSAVPPLEYAATRGVLGAQLKLARLYAKGRGVPKDDAKAFHYYQHIADQYADIPPSSPIARYVGEAFCALGRYYVGGIPAVPLQPDPAYAAGLFRHAGAYFGDAEAQYRLGRLYIAGTGVEKNQTIAANWLAMAARKQHAGAQAMLGEMLWRGDGVSQLQARGLALLMLANENAEKSIEDAEWIGQSYEKTFALADKVTRNAAEALLPKLSGSRTAASVKMSTPARSSLPPTPARAEPSEEPALTAAEEPTLGPVDLIPPAAMGMSAGFGASGGGIGGVQP